MKYKHPARMELLVGSWYLLKGTIQFGNETHGGFNTVEEALKAVNELNDELSETLGVAFRVSAHWWHELAVASEHSVVGKTANLNKSRSIELPYWLEQAKANKLPKPGRLVPPGFGTPGSDHGAFIHPDPERRKLCHDMMVYSFEEAENCMDVLGTDDIHVIYWTGPDGIRWQRLCNGDNPRLGYGLNQKLEEWKLVVGGVGNALKEANERGFAKRAKLLVEGKPGGDPCWLDIFTDDALCCDGIHEINNIAGEKIAWWQSELLHTHGAGIPFVQGMRIAMKRGVFGGHIHLNSGPVSVQNFSKLLAKKGGTPLSKFQQATDPDFLPGEGPREWLKHQEDALALGARWSAQTGNVLRCEFDARFARYADTIGALKKSAEFAVSAFRNSCERLGCDCSMVIE
jgi:hypothetical protein